MPTLTERKPFYSSCVDWPDNKLDALRYLVDEGKEISRSTFMRRVEIIGTPGDRWYPEARYHHGFFVLPPIVQHAVFEPVYWYTHSAIEFVYAYPETIDALQEMAVSDD